MRLGLSLTSLQGITATSWSSWPDHTKLRSVTFFFFTPKTWCESELVIVQHETRHLWSTQPSCCLLKDPFKGNNSIKSNENNDFGTDLWEFVQYHDTWGRSHQLGSHSWCHSEGSASVFSWSPSHQVPQGSYRLSPVRPSQLNPEEIQKFQSERDEPHKWDTAVAEILHQRWTLLPVQLLRNVKWRVKAHSSACLRDKTRVTPAISLFYDSELQTKEMWH